MCSQYQDSQGCTHCVETGKHFQAIQFGNADIENDQVGHAFTHHLHGIDTIIGFTDDLVALVFQQHANGKADDRMIVDNKNGVHNQIPASSDKARTLAQIVRGTYELTGLS
ncbi:hypothetical protein D3C73_981980 [compost metagenome]